MTETTEPAFIHGTHSNPSGVLAVATTIGMKGGGTTASVAVLRPGYLILETGRKGAVPNRPPLAVSDEQAVLLADTIRAHFERRALDEERRRDEEEVAAAIDDSTTSSTGATVVLVDPHTGMAAGTLTFEDGVRVTFEGGAVQVLDSEGETLGAVAEGHWLSAHIGDDPTEK